MVNSRVPLKNGRPIEDTISILVNGQVFSGWQSVDVQKNLESIAHGFSIKLFDKFAPLKSQWAFRPGSEIAVNINRERVITGYLEKIDVNYDSEDRSYVISGRSKAGDLVDCTHTGPNEYKDISLDALAQELIKPFGLKVFLSVTPSIIKSFAVKPGETVFEALDRAARLQGFFFVSTREGNIRLTRAARARSFSNLEQDVNILSASATYDDSQRHNQYLVKGQTAGLPNFSGANATQGEGSALDNGVTRHRPLTLIAEGNADSSQSETRAQWECVSRLAKATQVNVEVQGWTQADGSLWGINQLTRVKSRFLGINRDMLITSVGHKNDSDNGKTSTISLVDKQAYDPKPIVNEKDDLLSALGANF